MSRTLRLALGQLGAGPDRAANLAAARRAVHEAARAGAEVLVLPEYASCWLPRGLGREHAEPLDGPWLTGLRQTVAEEGVSVLVGTLVPAGERARNLVVALGPDGTLLGEYAKVHLYDAFGYRESEHLEPGDPAAAPLVVDLGLRLGVMTCFDLRFPESARRLVDAGAQVLCVPAAWVDGPGKAEHWRALALARAIESTAWVVAVGQAGPGRTGRSLAVAPDGTVRLELGPGPGLAVVELDEDSVRRERERSPLLALRRYAVVPRG